RLKNQGWLGVIRHPWPLIPSPPGAEEGSQIARDQPLADLIIQWPIGQWPWSARRWRCGIGGFKVRALRPGRTEMPEIYVHAVKGRTLEQKKALVKDITDAVVKNFGAPADAVVVSIIETEPTAKAKGGVLFSELRR